MKYMIATAAVTAICIILGTAAAHLIGRHRNLSSRRKALLAVFLSILLLSAGSLGYLETYYRATDAAEEYLKEEAGQRPANLPNNADASAVLVQKTDGGCFLDGPGESFAIILYGGAKVEETAYAPLLYRLAQRGVDCFLVKAPFRFAFMAAGAADRIMEEHEYRSWYLAGHSMGGVVTSSIAAKHPDTISGLILLASYPNNKLPDGIRLLSIYGSEDGCLDRKVYGESRKNYPADTQETVIEGGNHAQFGDYGLQKGDGTALISSEAQWDETADTIMNWISPGTEDVD